MRRPRVEVGLGVVVRALVLVADEEADRCAERDAVLDARLDRDLVVLVALRECEGRESASRQGEAASQWAAEAGLMHGRREVALAGPPPSKLLLDHLV